MRNRLRIIFTDLDGTLYPQSHPLFQDLRHRTRSWLIGRLGWAVEEAPERYREFVLKHPVLLEALTEFHIELREYHSAIFENALVDLLRPDQDLACFLGTRDCLLCVLTFAPERHATMILQRLGIASEVDRVITPMDFPTMCNKKQWVLQLLTQLGITPSDAVFVGDALEAEVIPVSTLVDTSVLVAEHGSSRWAPSVRRFVEVAQLPALRKFFSL